MSFQLRPGALAMCGLALFCLSSSAFAACSDDRVKRMSKQGRTVASIARTCDMDKEDVQSILEDEDDSPGSRNGGQSSNTGLPAGTPVGQCGCWGPVNPGMRQPQSECRSGYARPSMCNAPCPMGGFAWRGVCG